MFQRSRPRKITESESKVRFTNGILFLIVLSLSITLLYLNQRGGPTSTSTPMKPPPLSAAEASAKKFSEAYPTYELAPDVSGATLSEEETEQLTSTQAMLELEHKEEKKLLEEQTLESPNQYLDQEAYDAAPFIVVPFAKPMKQPLWWALKPYEMYGRIHPLKAYIPRLNPNIQLTPQTFHEQFRKHGQPVIINSNSLRDLGYRTRGWSFEEMQKAFPYSESTEGEVVSDYKANSIRRADEEIDLGPGLAAILRDEKLAKKGGLRNYPRNLHIKKEALGVLEVDSPPLIAGGASTWQLPTLWLGTTTADTPFHHDCCDNFVVMIAGVKRITLAPPTDWRTLNPICTGPNKSLCWANVADPTRTDLPQKSKDILAQCHIMVVDLQPGEILYMPAGWWHHIKNLGPTVMVNHWTRSLQQVGLVKVLKETS